MRVFLDFQGHEDDPEFGVWEIRFTIGDNKRMIRGSLIMRQGQDVDPQFILTLSYNCVVKKVELVRTEDTVGKIINMYFCNKKK